MFGIERIARATVEDRETRARVARTMRLHRRAYPELGFQVVGRSIRRQLGRGRAGSRLLSAGVRIAGVRLRKDDAPRLMLARPKGSRLQRPVRLTVVRERA